MPAIRRALRNWDQGTTSPKVNALIIAAMLAAGACGVPVQGAGGQDPIPESSDRFHRAPLPVSFYQDPLGTNGVTVENSEDVAKELPFEPNFPASGLGQPLSVYRGYARAGDSGP
jgi:hypothetical protein